MTVRGLSDGGSVIVRRIRAFVVVRRPGLQSAILTPTKASVIAALFAHDVVHMPFLVLHVDG